MSIFESLLERAGAKCELCSGAHILDVYQVPSSPTPGEASSILACQICRDQIESAEPLDVNHWRCLSESIWSEHEPVKVMSYRLLSRFQGEAWAIELIEQIYLDDESLNWARAEMIEKDEVEEFRPTLDSNGTRLLEGDSVTLVKDLDVKGAGFTAKRGTLVKNISLTTDPKHIEGKVNGVQIVLVAAYLKKA